jgi:hypothetical protein
MQFSTKIFSEGILKKGFGFGFRVAGAEAVDGGSCGLTRIRIQRHRSGLSIDFCGESGGAWDPLARLFSGVSGGGNPR